MKVIGAKAKLLTKEILEADYTKLQSIRKIGKKYGLSCETIRYYIHQFGIEYNQLKIHSVDHNIFVRHNEAAFYLAGFIAADGCVKCRKGKTIPNTLSIGLASKDEQFLYLIKQLLCAEAPVYKKIIKNSMRNPKWNDTSSSELIITSEKLCNDLAIFNIVPRKSLIYTFPSWLINHPLIHHYMRGYHDGDGSVYTMRAPPGKLTNQLAFSLRGTSEFLTTYRTILEQQCDLKIRTNPPRISSGHGVLEYGGNDLIPKIANFLYQVLSRKPLPKLHFGRG